MLVGRPVQGLRNWVASRAIIGHHHVSRTIGRASVVCWRLVVIDRRLPTVITRSPVSLDGGHPSTTGTPTTVVILFFKDASFLSCSSIVLQHVLFQPLFDARDPHLSLDLQWRRIRCAVTFQQIPHLSHRFLILLVERVATRFIHLPFRRRHTCMSVELHSHPLFQLCSIGSPPVVHHIFVLEAGYDEDDRYFFAAYDAPEKVVIDANDVSHACAPDAVDEKAHSPRAVFVCAQLPDEGDEVGYGFLCWDCSFVAFVETGCVPESVFLVSRGYKKCDSRLQDSRRICFSRPTGCQSDFMTIARRGTSVCAIRSGSYCLSLQHVYDGTLSDACLTEHDDVAN